MRWILPVVLSIADWLSSCKLGYKLLRVGIMPCHLICPAVHVEILLMLIRVIKQDWTQMSNIQSTSVEVHGKTPGNYTIHGIFGLRAKYTQAKELFSLEVWRILWKLWKLYTVQNDSSRKVFWTFHIQSSPVANLVSILIGQMQKSVLIMLSLNL